ncbi:MAG TPA: hypothetical protein VMY42_06430 [Thermoguttaceae bacterium]|nr:hypothetical protein [Thermoguttaceae bacterium]
MSRLLMSAALALLFVVGTTLAQDGDKKKEGPEKPKKSIEDVFKAKDKNGDGKLSFDEIKGKIDKPEALDKLELKFKALDKNGDKALTLEEFTAKPERTKKPAGEKPEKKPGEKREKKAEK